MGRRGVVIEMQLFNTVLRQSDRSLAVLPNGDIQKSGLVNFTRLGISRVDLPFTLKYSEDIEKARALIMDIMTSDPRVLKDPPPVVVRQANGRQRPGDAGADVCAIRGLRSGSVQLLAVDYREVDGGGHRTGSDATEYSSGGTWIDKPMRQVIVMVLPSVHFSYWQFSMPLAGKVGATARRDTD